MWKGQSLGAYDYIQTRRRTEMYFCKGMKCRKGNKNENVIRGKYPWKGSVQWNEEITGLKIATLLLKAGYSVRIGRQQIPESGNKNRWSIQWNTGRKHDKTD